MKINEYFRGKLIMDSGNSLNYISYFLETMPPFLSAKLYGSFLTSPDALKKGEIRQIDLILAVDNIEEFYRECVSKNPYMYRMIPSLFFSHATQDQLKMLGTSCYTSHINFMDNYYKMGVIEKDDLIADLKEWKTFFMAGRFQKEMMTLKRDCDIEEANIINKKNAVIAAFLLLNKDNPSLGEFYQTLCSLSYIGDERIRLHAEDPNKQVKLAQNSKNFFDTQYTAICSYYDVLDDGTIIYNYEDILRQVVSLPQDLRYRLYDVMKLYFGEEDQVIRLNIAKEIYDYLFQKTSKASRDQILKGVITTGPVNSVHYTLAKLKKGRMKGN